MNNAKCKMTLANRQTPVGILRARPTACVTKGVGQVPPAAPSRDTPHRHAIAPTCRAIAINRRVRIADRSPDTPCRGRLPTNRGRSPTHWSAVRTLQEGCRPNGHRAFVTRPGFAGKMSGVAPKVPHPAPNMPRCAAKHPTFAPKSGRSAAEVGGFATERGRCAKKCGRFAAKHPSFATTHPLFFTKSGRFAAGRGRFAV